MIRQASTQKGNWINYEGNRTFEAVAIAHARAVWKFGLLYADKNEITVFVRDEESPETVYEIHVKRETTYSTKLRGGM